MCEGIARVGNGTSMMVTEQESTTITGKIARLLKAARTPCVSNVRVDWGREEVPEAASEDNFDFVSAEAADVVSAQTKFDVFDHLVNVTELESPVPEAPRIRLPPPAMVQQSPKEITVLAPGSRLHVYAILQGQSYPFDPMYSNSTHF